MPVIKIRAETKKLLDDLRAEHGPMKMWNYDQAILHLSNSKGNSEVTTSNLEVTKDKTKESELLLKKAIDRGHL